MLRKEPPVPVRAELAAGALYGPSATHRIKPKPALTPSARHLTPH